MYVRPLLFGPLNIHSTFFGALIPYFLLANYIFPILYYPVQQ